jgi:hypothetical protein
MNILYFNPSSTPGAEGRMITDPCDGIVSTRIRADALRLIHKQSFDAVVIESEAEDSTLLDFTLEVYGVRPKLPVFLTNDWGTDLPMGLKGLATGAFAW